MANETMTTRQIKGLTYHGRKSCNDEMVGSHVTMLFEKMMKDMFIYSKKEIYCR